MSRDEYADDPDRTIVRPNPGGRRPQPAPDISATRLAFAAAELRRPAAVGPNPLLAAAAYLFGLIARLRERVPHRDLEDLRHRVLNEIRGFETAAAGAGIPPDQVRAARYALAATVDDLVLATDWGAQSLWAQRGMVSTLYNEASGGERFFTLLEQLEADAARNAPVLELFHACLSLGFEGRYRIQPGGAAELSQVREALFRRLQGGRPEAEPALSPHWQGLAAAYRPVPAAVPLWVVLAVLAGLLAAVYWGLALMLNSRSDLTFGALQAIAAGGPAEIARAAPPTPEPVLDAQPVVPALTDDGLFQRVSTALQPELDAGALTVGDSADAVMIRVGGTAMFRSGSSTIADGFGPLMARIAAALDAEPGLVTVAGHTDDVPIRSVRFPSNWHLSVARAEAVAEALRLHLSDPGRLLAEGRADTEPIASNDTPEGRDANRRIEILLQKQP